MNNNTNKTIKVSYELHKETIEWIASEAITNNMTQDEIVESLVYTVRFLSEALEVEGDNRRSTWMFPIGGEA